jgi:hypothetical protein
MSDQFVSTPASVDVVKTGSSAISEPSLNTSALKDAAKAFLNNGATPASTPVEQPVSPVSPVQRIPISVSDAPKQAPTPQSEIPSDQKVVATDPNTGQKTEIDLMSIPDDAIVRVKRNGEVVTISGKEARDDAMRGAKFTHEMQQLRAKEDGLKQRFEQAQTLERLVTDDVALAEYIFRQKPHIVETLAQHMGLSRQEAATVLATEVQHQAANQPNQPAPFTISNPDELANLGEVDTLFQSRSQQLERQVLEQVKRELGTVNSTVQDSVRNLVANAVKNEISTLRNAHEVATFDGEIKSTISDIIKTNPALSKIPRIEQLIRFEVFQMKPQTPDELKEALHHVASGIVEGLDETYQTARKTSIIDKATMEKTGIEPPVGTAPTFTRPISYEGANGKFSFDEMKRAAKAALGA